MYLQPPELSGDIFLSFDYSREQSCYFSFQKDFEFKKCHTHTKILHIVPVYLVLEKEISEAIFCMRMRDRQRFHNVEKTIKVFTTCQILRLSGVLSKFISSKSYLTNTLMIFDMPYINCHLVLIIAPATQAFKKLVKQPATKARRTILAKSSLRSGAMAPNPPNWIPIDEGLAKPHSA